MYITYKAEKSEFDVTIDFEEFSGLPAIHLGKVKILPSNRYKTKVEMFIATSWSLKQANEYEICK